MKHLKCGDRQEVELSDEIPPVQPKVWIRICPCCDAQVMVRPVYKNIAAPTAPWLTPPVFKMDLEFTWACKEIDGHLGELKDYLEYHEDDIFHGINDFGDLKEVFKYYFGRYPRETS